MLLNDAALDALVADPPTGRRLGTPADFDDLSHEQQFACDKAIAALKMGRWGDAASAFDELRDGGWKHAHAYYALSLLSDPSGYDRREGLGCLSQYMESTLQVGEPADPIVLLAMVRSQTGDLSDGGLSGALQSAGLRACLALYDAQSGGNLYKYGSAAELAACQEETFSAARLTQAIFALERAGLSNGAQIVSDAAHSTAASEGLDGGPWHDGTKRQERPRKGGRGRRCTPLPVDMPLPPAAPPFDASQRMWQSIRSGPNPMACPAMDELMELRGLQRVKERALELYKTVKMEKLLKPEQRVVLSLNFSLMGNPGCGKTSVGRILGKLLHQLGLRPRGTFKEVHGESLLREGAGKIEKTIEASLGGVLFIDEAYLLQPDKTKEGAAILGQLLSAAENHRDRLTIMFAGYQDEIETELYGANPGLKSRFTDIIFDDFGEDELRSIFISMVRAKGWQPAPYLAEVAGRRLARGRGKRGFGNARECRSLFELAYMRALRRMDASDATAIGSILSDTETSAKVRSLMPDAVRSRYPSLIYRASEHGFEPEDFQARCQKADGEGELLLVVLAKPGPCVAPSCDSDEDAEAAAAAGGASRQIFGVYSEIPWPFSGSVHRAKGPRAKDSLYRSPPPYAAAYDEAILLDNSSHSISSDDDASDEVSSPEPKQAGRTSFYFWERGSSTDPEASHVSRNVQIVSCDALGPCCVASYADFEPVSRIVTSGDNDGSALLVWGSDVSLNAPNAHCCRSASSTHLFTAIEIELFAMRLVLTIEDVIGPPITLERSPGLRAALSELDEQVGLTTVKQEAHALVKLVRDNYQRQLAGEPIRDVPLCRLFLGNPGTGKTTVAKIYGRILKGLGLLSDGNIVLKTPSDLIGEYVGATEAKMASVIEMSRGKVLVIDEAYALNSGSFGSRAIDTLVSKVHNAEGEDIAVLLLGYKEQMAEMIRTANPGLARRFSFESAFYFEDFTDAELERLLYAAARRKGLTITRKVRKEAVKMLARERIKPNFGNAGAVNNLIGKAALRLASTKGPFATELTLEDIGSVGETASKVDLLAEVNAELSRLYKVDLLSKHFAEVSQLVGQLERDDKLDPMRPAKPVGNYIFVGQPGTGKTTGARILSKFLFARGLLATDTTITCSALNLTGEYLGQTKKKVDDLFAQAAGGLLFIDEAYTLSGGSRHDGGTSYQQEAVDQLTYNMTSDAYKERTVVVLAGYEAQMDQMMKKVNPGFASRFEQRIEFPNWSAADTVGYLQRVCAKEGIALGEQATAALSARLERLRVLPGWANARDGEAAYKGLYSARIKRLQGESEPTREMTTLDVEMAMDDMERRRTSKGSSGGGASSDGSWIGVER